MNDYKLKIKLEVLEGNQLLYQVLEQSSDITSCDEPKEFLASNGVTVKSRCFPEYSAWGHTIWIRGRDEEDDWNVALLRPPFNDSVSDAKQMKLHLLQAFTEWGQNGYFGKSDIIDDGGIIKSIWKAGELKLRVERWERCVIMMVYPYENLFLESIYLDGFTFSVGDFNNYTGISYDDVHLNSERSGMAIHHLSFTYEEDAQDWIDKFKKAFSEYAKVQFEKNSKIDLNQTIYTF